MSANVIINAQGVVISAHGTIKITDILYSDIFQKHQKYSELIGELKNKKDQKNILKLVTI